MKRQATKRKKIHADRYVTNKEPSKLNRKKKTTKKPSVAKKHGHLTKDIQMAKNHMILNIISHHKNTK